MRIYISFDLHKADGGDYADLYRYLEKIGAIQASESFYVIKDTNLTPKEIKNKIVEITEGDITVIVGPMQYGVFTYKAKDTEKWLDN